MSCGAAKDKRKLTGREVTECPQSCDQSTPRVLGQVGGWRARWAASPWEGPTPSEFFIIIGRRDYATRRASCPGRALLEGGLSTPMAGSACSLELPGICGASFLLSYHSPGLPSLQEPPHLSSSSQKDLWQGIQSNGETPSLASTPGGQAGVGYNVLSGSRGP